MDALDVTPEMALEDALKAVRNPKYPRPNKALILLLHDEDAKYDVSFFNSGMKTSEMVTLCETHKARVMRWLLGLEEP